MKKTLLTAGIILSGLVYSQVGVNNNTPKATLDVTAKTTDGSKPEGMIAPRLTGDQIKSADANYGTDQKGTLIYATAAVATSSTKTVNITEEGYYYFDGSLWQRIINNNTQNTLSADNGLTVGYNTAGKIGLGGTLGKNTEIATTGNTLGFSGTGNVGVGTKTPISHFSVSNDGGGSGSPDDISIFSYGTNFSPSFISMTSRGSEATPANLNSGDTLGGFIFGGRWNNQWNYTASGVLADYLGGTDTNLRFVTAFNERMRISPTGNVGIGSNNPATKLEVVSDTSGTSGVRFTNLKNATTLATNASGDVIAIDGSSVSKQRLVTAGPSIIMTTQDGNYSFRYSSTAVNGAFQIRNNTASARSVSVFINEWWNNGSSNYSVSTGTASLAAGSWTAIPGSTNVGTDNELNLFRIYDITSGTIYRMEGNLVNSSGLKEAMLVEQF